MARTAKEGTALTVEEKLVQALVPEAEQPYKVPANWRWVTASNLSLTISKGTTPQGGKDCYVDDGVKFLRVENICEDGTISHDAIMHVSENMHTGFLKRSVLHEGDILVSIAGTLGKTAVVRRVDLPLNTNQAVSFIRLKSREIDPQYIKLSFDNPIIQEHLLSQTKVTSIPNLTLEIIGNCPIPFPPLAEQQRIVDRIESLFAKLDEAKEKAQAVVDGFEDRKAAILHKAFTGELTAEWRKDVSKSFSEWMPKSIGEISDVKGGKRVPKGMTLTDVDTGHPYIKAGNLKQGTVIDNDISFVPDDVLPFIKNYTVSAGDVYITNVGACIGDCGVIPPKYDGANLTENAVKLTNLHCVSEYLAWYLSSNNVQRLIKSLVASATLGKLSIANIKTIPVLLPSEEEQLKIIEVINQLLEQEQHAKEAAEQVIDQIDTMKKAILARAFRGELGTNDPTDESAEELLKRVL